ncbi:helix-turn-helix transcriptional regulator [Streptomyces sp. SID8111]|uniref:helix-turn-helix domain-containing protein n=1 Tax=Streptomyces sp. SID8111 TaxID=2706100 RepID=UPI0013C0B31B|nr:helix-turn-helix transcriptional regulator [Streptomyces sp. SID8111]NEC25164.1 helix-turn-helix transcriptional regulator [Streptomyces sp. SID8111]
MTNGSQPEPPLDAPFSAWLKWALTRAGYDPDERGVQRKFADASGIPVATVSRLLRDKGAPDVSTCYLLGRTFNVRVMPLLVRAGHLPPEALAQDTAPDRPSPPTTEEQALTALGIVDETDRAAIRTMVQALTNKHRREGTS